MSKAKLYHVDVGRSSGKPGIGACGIVEATSKKEALSIFVEAVSPGEISVRDNHGEPDEDGIDYINVYFSEDVKDYADADISEA